MSVYVCVCVRVVTYGMEACISCVLVTGASKYIIEMDSSILSLPRAEVGKDTVGWRKGTALSFN